jgi:hypothetical protein
MEGSANMVAWDCTRNWVLHRFWHDLTRVTICFQHVPPSVAELAAVRRCLPQFRHIAPASLRTATDGGVLPLGILPSSQAHFLIEAARGQGLEVLADNASFASYLPVDRTAGSAWLIEDHAEATAVAQAMRAAGVPVQEVHAEDKPGPLNDVVAKPEATSISSRAEIRRPSSAAADRPPD